MLIAGPAIAKLLARPRLRSIFQPLRGRTLVVLDLEPSLAPAGSVGRIPPLRDDAFEPELAGVLKYLLSIAGEVLREAGYHPGIPGGSRAVRVALWPCLTGLICGPVH